jgi:hypothetical protein
MIKEVIETFKKKYNFEDIWDVTVSEDLEGDKIIQVFTSNAKIWVDLPSKHEGYSVKMNVAKKPVVKTVITQ